MFISLKSASALILLFVTSLIARTLIIKLRRARMASRHGCQPIAQHPHSGLLTREYDRGYKESWRVGRIKEFRRKQYELSGSSTYKITGLSEDSIFSCDPAIRQAICTDLGAWQRDPRRAAAPLSGVNIINQNGAAWKHTRELVNPLFKRAELSEIDNFRIFVDRMMHLIPRDGSTFDLQPIMRKLFIDSSTDSLFGKPIDALRDTTPKSDEFVAALNRATAGAGKRIRPTGLISKFYKLGTLDKQWLADCKIVHDFIDACIAEHRSSNAKTSTSESRKRYVLMDGMSQAIADPIKLRFQLMGMFSLARETPAMTFTNLIFLLARNPEAWTQLRARALTINEDDMTFEFLKNLTPFRHAVQEGLRLLTPVPRARRMAICDTVLPRGGGTDGSAPLFVEKGTTVWCDMYPSTRDPKIWGDDVDDFRPSRFEDRKLGWDFTPFNRGPRMCPANQQVMIQCTYLLVRLTREFAAIENRDPCWDYVENALMAYESRNGCLIALHPSVD